MSLAVFQITFLLSNSIKPSINITTSPLVSPDLYSLNTHRVLQPILLVLTHTMTLNSVTAIQRFFDQVNYFSLYAINVLVVFDNTLLSDIKLNLIISEKCLQEYILFLQIFVFLLNFLVGFPTTLKMLFLVKSC